MHHDLSSKNLSVVSLHNSLDFIIDLDTATKEAASMDHMDKPKAEAEEPSKQEKEA